MLGLRLRRAVVDRCRAFEAALDQNLAAFLAAAVLDGFDADALGDIIQFHYQRRPSWRAAFLRAIDVPATIH